MRAISPHVAYISLIALTAAACGGTEDADSLNNGIMNTMPTGSDTSASPGVVGTMPGPVDTTPDVATGPAVVGPTTPTPTTTSETTAPGPEVVVDPGPDSTDPVPTMMETSDVPDAPGPDTTITPTEPTSVAPVPTEPGPGPDPDPGPEVPMEGEGMGGATGMEPEVPPPEMEVTPYSPREGSFKMLVYYKTAGFEHNSIDAGKRMLQEIATEQGFEIKETKTNEDITFEGLSQYEIVFFMNSTGDIFNNQEQQAYEQWMTEADGAFAGVHSATDTENGWAFYSDVTGQYYSGHGNQGTQGQIQFEADMLDFPAVAGLPNPWSRQEEWYNFNQHQTWSAQPGFMILGRKAADGQPITWAREWGNFRAFYTAIGHDPAVFQNDNDVKRHLTGGIMWAVRREHLIK